jgi:hypothetical protein
MRSALRVRHRKRREETGRCVVSLATDRDFYPLSLDRLGESLRHVGFRGAFLPWAPGAFPPDCPSQLEVPFAFKPFCVAEARARGAKTVLWLDSSCLVVRSLDPIFREIETNGYVLFKNGSHRVGEWASDHTLSEFGLSRDRALTLPEVNAAVVGLHLDSPLGVEFLESWLAAARKETPFRGIPEAFESWDDYEDVKWNRTGRASPDARVHGHRHDQTVAGILADRLGMELTLEGLEDHLDSDAGDLLRPTTSILIDRFQAFLPIPPPAVPRDPSTPAPPALRPNPAGTQAWAHLMPGSAGSRPPETPG